MHEIPYVLPPFSFFWYISLVLKMKANSPFYFAVKTCGKPHIQNIMSNVTAKPGQQASFKCQVDMSCIVAYIEWYHEMDNGTEKLIKVSLHTCQILSIYWARPRWRPSSEEAAERQQ